MIKRDLLIELDKLENEKGVKLDGISQNCNKNTIQNAIDCLNCSDDLLDKYLTVLTLKYPSTGAKIAENGDYKRHCFNRLYVYNMARLILTH